MYKNLNFFTILFEYCSRKFDLFSIILVVSLLVIISLSIPWERENYICDLFSLIINLLGRIALTALSLKCKSPLLGRLIVQLQGILPRATPPALLILQQSLCVSSATVTALFCVIFLSFKINAQLANTMMFIFCKVICTSVKDNQWGAGIGSCSLYPVLWSLIEFLLCSNYFPKLYCLK